MAGVSISSRSANSRPRRHLRRPLQPAPLVLHQTRVLALRWMPTLRRAGVATGVTVTSAGGVPPDCAVIGETTGPAGRRHLGLLVLRCEELSRPTVCSLPMLQLLVRWGAVLLPLEALFCAGRAAGHATLAAETRPLASGLIDHFPDVGVVDVGDVHVIDAAVVVEVPAPPIATLVSMTRIAVAVVHPAVVTDVRAPVAGVPAI